MYPTLPRHVVSRRGFQGCLASLDVQGEAPDPVGRDVPVRSSNVVAGCDGTLRSALTVMGFLLLFICIDFVSDLDYQASESLGFLPFLLGCSWVLLIILLNTLLMETSLLCRPQQPVSYGCLQQRRRLRTAVEQLLLQLWHDFLHGANLQWR